MGRGRWRNRGRERVAGGLSRARTWVIFFRRGEEAHDALAPDETVKTSQGYLFVVREKHGGQGGHPVAEERWALRQEVPGRLVVILAQSARDVSGVMHIGQVILEKVMASDKLNN